MYWAWLGLYILSLFMVPPTKDQRGYIWRTLRKLPPWRFIKGLGMLQRVVRFVILIFCWEAVISVGFGWNYQLFYGGLIVTFLDDYVNGGDDDHWKKFKAWARNKIKWKMLLPAPPQNVRESA